MVLAWLWAAKSGKSVFRIVQFGCGVLNVVRSVLYHVNVGGGGAGGYLEGDLILTKNYIQDNCNGNNSQSNRYYFEDGKCQTLGISHSMQTANIIQNSTIRRLTPTECSRLQTIPDWCKWECSDTQQYRMLGNGWTVKVIQHILSFLK